MSTELLLRAAAGAAIAAGLLAVAAAAGDLGTRARTRIGPALRTPVTRRLALAAAVGLASAAATGWPVAGALAAAGMWWLPPVLGPDRTTAAAVARIEAVASWAEMLRDMIAGASGLSHAIATSAPIAPEAIRPAVHRLQEDLQSRDTTPEEALEAFAAAAAVPTGDLVAIALSHAHSGQTGDVGAVLGRLAEAARERAASLQRVAAARARLRTSVRIIIATSIALALGLVLLDPDFLTPYATPTGQLVLAVAGAIWAGALVWLQRMARPDLGRRLLTPRPAAAPAGEAA
ncbi:type II secretion system F family protein [Streptomonospora salina]|uniref:Flp pilus assembly protein TadB n=1 Tax=Streptomonospora salina TaxID=104205 RepID=A0A841EAR9_9ACTN|nr:type II secretion protein F [Streptomonospora salina]MBB6000102.1 Flp pilus assembly protein TadB [Streptomonospora salina]